MESKLQAFSSDGNLLAICDLSGILKIWNTQNGFLEHEFHPAEYLSSSTTCIHFSPKNFKSRKKKSQGDSFDEALAMGTVDGTVLVYSHFKQAVIAKLRHSSASAVSDLWWTSPSELITLGQAQKLIFWNVFTKTKLKEIDIAGGESLCVIGKNILSVASYRIQLLHIDTKEEYHLAGHKTSITQLIPIVINQEENAKYILSAAENDRFVYAWSTDCKQKEPVASFMANDIVRTVACLVTSGPTVDIAITTKKGYLRYLSHHLNGSKYHKPIKYQGSLSIYSQSDSDCMLPIFGINLISSTTLTIVYGTTLYPQCERIFIKELQGEVTYTRKDPRLFDKERSGLVKTVTPHVSDEAVHLMPTQTNFYEVKEGSRKRKKGDDAPSLPMEERLESLALTKTLSGTAKGRPLDNYVHLLVQALHSKDTNLLGNILLKGEEEEEIIYGTVRRLPVSCVVPFLKFLQEIITGQGIKNVSLITWIKVVFQFHMSHLSSIPDKEEIMRPFYAVCASRISTLPTITKLHSRINLLLTQVKTRHEYASQKSSSEQTDALLVYKEESSDDEDLNMALAGTHSESEDTWDFLTEDEQEGLSDEDHRSPDGEKLKRKTAPNMNLGINEDDAISISENDEQATDENDGMIVDEQSDSD